MSKGGIQVHAYVDIFIRTISSLLLLLLIARMLGKQTISNMTFHDFVTGITLGAIAGNLAFNEKIKSWYFVFSLIVFAFTSLFLSYLSMKNRKIRNWVSGSPTVLIEGGRILEENMRKNRYTIDTLNQQLREKEIFDIEHVEYATLEDNGKLSVLRKEVYQFVTKKDLHVQPGTVSYPVELIMDGQVISDNLTKNNLTLDWLECEVKDKGKTIADVFYAVRGTKQQLVFNFYDDNVRKPVDKE